MGKIVISKGKILKGDIVEITYTEQKNSAAKPSKHADEYKDIPHPDLKKAFAGLAIHAALLGEFIQVKDVPDITKVKPELVKDFNISGFSLSGNDLDCVIITAQKTLSSGKLMGFNTTLTRFSDESETAHTFMDELVEAIDLCKDELLAYMNGKFGDEVQGELEFPHQEGLDETDSLPF